MVLVVTPIAAVDHIGWPVPDALAALCYVTDFWSNGFSHLCTAPAHLVTGSRGAVLPRLARPAAFHTAA